MAEVTEEELMILQQEIEALRGGVGEYTEAIIAKLKEAGATGALKFMPAVQAIDDFGSFNEEAEVSLSVQAVTLYNLPIRYSIVDGELPSGLILESDGTIVGALSNLVGNRTFSFTIQADNQLGTPIQKAFSLTVLATNDSPVWSTVAGSLNVARKGVAYSHQLTGSDPEGESIAYSLKSGSSLPSGLMMDQNGLISGTPATDAASTTFTVELTDGTTLVTRTFSVDVDEEPIWNTSSGQLGVHSIAEEVSHTLSASDPEGGALTYRVSAGALPAGLVLSEAGVISGTISDMETSNHIFSVSASDQANTVTRQFSIQVTNSAPLWNSAADLGTQTSGVNVQLDATDPEGMPLTYAIVSGSLPAGLSLSSSGLISGDVSNPDGNDYTFTVEASDGHNATTRAFTIHTNTPPFNLVINGAGTGDLAQGNNGVLLISALAQDAQNDVLQYHWTVSGGSLNKTTGNSVELTLPYGGGPVTVTCRAFDGVAWSDTASVTWSWVNTSYDEGYQEWVTSGYSESYEEWAETGLKVKISSGSLYNSSGSIVGTFNSSTMRYVVIGDNWGRVEQKTTSTRWVDTSHYENRTRTITQGKFVRS